MRLIDADALHEKETYMLDEALGWTACVLTEDIKEAPAVDAVEVVRCGECIHNNPEAHIPGFAYCKLYKCAKDPDGYCDEGERKAEPVKHGRWIMLEDNCGDEFWKWVFLL